MVHVESLWWNTKKETVLFVFVAKCLKSIPPIKVWTFLFHHINKQKKLIITKMIGNNDAKIFFFLIVWAATACNIENCVCFTVTLFVSVSVVWMFSPLNCFTFSSFSTLFYYSLQPINFSFDICSLQSHFYWVFFCAWKRM